MNVHPMQEAVTQPTSVPHRKLSPLEMDRIAPSRDERLFLVLSIFIGVLSGLLVVSFRVAIEWIKILTLGSAPHGGQFRLLFVPALAGLFVAALVQLFFPAARGSGVIGPARKMTRPVAFPPPAVTVSRVLCGLTSGWC